MKGECLFDENWCLQKELHSVIICFCGTAHKTSCFQSFSAIMHSECRLFSLNKHKNSIIWLENVGLPMSFFDCFNA